MTEEPNIYAYLINSVVMTFILMLIFGVMHKLVQVLMAIFAYPVYLAMYEFEDFTGIKSSSRKFFQLNIPKENPKKFFMNFCASMSIFLMLPNFNKLYTIFSNNPDASNKLMVDMFFGSNDFQMWSNLAIIFLARQQNLWLKSGSGNLPSS